MREFLWGDGLEGSQKIAWVSWSPICRPKEDGGLGVKDLEVFNRALLGKWRWRLMIEDNSLWVKVLAENIIELSQKMPQLGGKI